VCSGLDENSIAPAEKWKVPSGNAPCAPGIGGAEWLRLIAKAEVKSSSCGNWADEHPPPAPQPDRIDQIGRGMGESVKT
jgi:hypothetical protein